MVSTSFSPATVPVLIASPALLLSLAAPPAAKVTPPSPLGLSSVVAAAAAAVTAAADGVVAAGVVAGVVAAVVAAVVEPPGAAAAGDGRFTARNSVGSGGRTLFNFRGLGSVADNAAAASATPPSLPPLNVNPGV